LNEPGFEQVDVRPSIHLAFERLEAVNLPFSLPVRPWFPKRHGDGCLISPQPAGKGTEQPVLRFIQPSFQLVFASIAHHVHKPVGQPSGCGESRQRSFDPCDLDGIRLAQMIPAQGKEADNLARGRRFFCA
jgi:hypothetical protein